MSERRTDKRFDVCLDAVWDGRRGNYSARVTDLSDNGCYVDSLGEALVGEILHFRVQLPSGDWLELTGEVAHHATTIGFGLQFIDLEEDTLEKLRWLISYLRGPHEQVSAVLTE
jgi:PilZ domain